jgi:hypothetical protein
MPLEAAMRLISVETKAASRELPRSDSVISDRKISLPSLISDH